MSPETFVFQSPSLGQIKFHEVVGNLVGYMAEEPNNKYKVVVGTDSHTNGYKDKKQLDFVTALVVHRSGKGGRYFWKKTSIGKIHTLRQKIYQETYFSINLANILIEELKSKLQLIEKELYPKYEFEIHIDVGENGQTRDMIKEVVGLVKGNGFSPKTKPESFGASNVADKHA